MGVHTSIDSDVGTLFANKSFEQLKTLEGQIKTKLSQRNNVDAEYWDGLHKKLQVAILKTRINDLYQAAVQTKLGKLKEAEARAAAEAGSAAAAESGSEEDADHPVVLHSKPTLASVAEAASFKIELSTPAPAFLAGIRPGARESFLYKSEQELYQMEANKPMGDGEEEFREEVS